MKFLYNILTRKRIELNIAQSQIVESECKEPQIQSLARILSVFLVRHSQVRT